MKKKIFYSNKIEEIIYVDLQVDELQMFGFFLIYFSPGAFLLNKYNIQVGILLRHWIT